MEDEKNKNYLMKRRKDYLLKKWKMILFFYLLYISIK
jgi:hypothetical protein